MDGCVKEEGKKDFKELFRNLLKNMLELRILMPPIYNLDPKYILVDTETNEVKIVPSNVLLEKENAYIPVDISKEDLQFKSPEELDGEERNLTTPFWTIGVMLYQAKFGKHPFETSLKPKAME